MDTIKYLLSKIVLLAIIIGISIFLFWVGKIIAPLLPQELFMRNQESLVSKGASSTEFFLPTPGSFSTGQVKTPSVNDNVYVSGTNETSGTEFHAYDTEGTQGSWQPNGNGQYVYVQAVPRANTTNTDNQVFDATKAGFSQMSAYLRGITIPLGAYVYRGLIFHGQARESMFVNGRFSLFVIDVHGNVIGQGQAVTDENWQTPGWHSFRGTITTTIPTNALGCGLVFQQDKIRGLHATMPVTCR